MCINKQFLISLFFLVFFDLSVSEAQRKVLSNQAGNTEIFQNISSVDQMSDADIEKLKQQMQANGISIEQAQQAALAKGMSPAEWSKLQARLSSPSATTQNKTSGEPTSISGPVRQVEKSDYQVYQKGPSSNVFGSSFFDSPSLSFEPNLRVATPVNYILGPDDELLINVSGYQETNIKTAVQPEGAIFIPQVGSIIVNGLTIEEATARIRDKMSQTAYPSIKSGLSKLIISLSKIRSIHITVVGAAKPGNYVTSSLSTVFNSLYQSGGPGDINTYRDIELIRNNKVYQKIDIYQFLTKGDQKGNVPLKENDVINFPVYKKRVTISGQVKRPGVFELKDGESFENLLFFAGGYTDRAYKATIKVKQNTDIERKIKDISKLEIAAYLPENGDEFQVDAILDRFENAVSIKGAVYRPGQFELTPGITIKSLIQKAGGLQENAFTDRAVLTRTHIDGTKENITFNVSSLMNSNSSDIPLIKNDEIIIATVNEFKSNYSISIAGEVRKPGAYPYKENLSLKDMFFLAGGFTDAASSYHVEISRRIVGERSTNIDSIAKVFDMNIEKGLGIENNKFILMPYDAITVRKNPAYTEQKRVTIEGEVNFPGSYTIESKNEHISDLLKRAGGLTPLAYAKGTFLIRNNTQGGPQQQEVAKTVQTSIKDTSTKVIEDITRTNLRIPVNLEEVLKRPGSIEDYVLENGDEIQVLKTDPLVKLSGEVLSSTKTGFIAGKNIDYYLSQAGGTTDNARRSKIYVLHANGTIGRTNNGIFGLFRSYPSVDAGSEIIVPRKTDKKGLDAQQTISLTSAIVSLVSLILVTISVLKN
ncbi:SLBB domain-containing protein [Mucilaginibacter sp. AW1-3]